jgi:hypothetical protein
VLSVLRVRWCNFDIVTNLMKIGKKTKLIIKNVGRTVDIGCDNSVLFKLCTNVRVCCL